MSVTNSVKLVELENSLGDYARRAGIYHSKQVFSGMQSLDLVNVYDAVSDEVPMIVDEIQDVIQVGDSENFTPTDAYSMKAEILKVRDFKVDLIVNPLKFHKNYTALKKPKGSNPFVFWFEYLMVDKLLKKVRANLERAIWQGVYDPAPLPAIGIPIPTKVTDGFLKQIVDNEAKCNQRNTGVITDLNAVDAVERTLEDHPSHLLTEETTALMSEPVFKMFLRNYRERFKELPYNKEYGRYTIDSTSMIKIVPVRELGNSQRIIVDGSGVLSIATDAFTDFGNIEIQKENRTIKFLMDGKIGTGISCWEVGGDKLITINDQL